MSMSSLDDPDYEATFRAAFVEDMAVYAGVNRSAVSIDSILSGSVTVRSTITFEYEDPAQDYAASLATVNVTEIFVSDGVAQHAGSADVYDIEGGISVGAAEVRCEF
eukprot:gene3338-4197_t